MPPRLARRLVSALAPEHDREYLLGDLDEQFERTAASDGVGRAARRYWSQALRSLWHVRRIERHAAAGARVRGRWTMATFIADVRLGLRSLWRSPGFSLVSMLTLALAIGANTLLFSLANPLVVRALPIEDPGRLGWVMLSHPERMVSRGPASMADYLEWRDTLSSFSALAAYGIRQSTMTGRGDATRVTVAQATANLQDVWGLQPVIGRLFLSGEDAAERQGVVVLSHRYWRESFSAEAQALGSTFFLDGRPVTVVGVMQPSIELGNLSLIDLWMPAPLEIGTPRDARAWRVVGRLAPAATLASANAELQAQFATQVAADPQVYEGWSAAVGSTQDALAPADTYLILALLGVIVLFVLLIACANLANLTMARLVGKRREIDVRVALGAGRWQVVRPLVAEGLVLGAAGGLAGLAIAYGGLKAINAAAFEPFLRAVGIDGNVLVFTAIVSVVAPAIFTLWPALSAGRASLTGSLHGARTGSTRGATRRRNLLVASQVAMAVALLFVSALTIQSMFHLRRTDLGYDPRPLLTWKFTLPADRFATDPARAAFISTLDAELAGHPGAPASAVISHLPVLDLEAIRSLSGTARDSQAESDRPWISWFAVSPGYFDALGIPVLAGRGVDAGDRAGRQAVAVLSRSAAERYFDDPSEALGRTLTVHDARTGDRVVTVVGLAGDTRDNQLIRTSPQLYVPIDQWPVADLTGVVRAAGDPASLAADVRQIMRRLDADIAVSDLKPLAQIIREELSSSAIINGLFLAMAALALALASAGLFGVISYAVGQRRSEFGVRLALGASPRAIARMIVLDGLRVTAYGVAAGAVLAFAMARAASGALVGIAPTDPATFAGVAALVVTTALLAAWVPALRAMRVDPSRTLRADS